MGAAQSLELKLVTKAAMLVGVPAAAAARSVVFSWATGLSDHGLLTGFTPLLASLIIVTVLSVPLTAGEGAAAARASGGQSPSCWLAARATRSRKSVTT
eukprot:NODE_3525_length_774_cov_239.806676.p2 GENE.NODE_3525_length_774_cov_239.806676~~NODE_3525_length_774_cov_239.806676.p2  ORF type:complete len:108 (-),score=20.58 NODE_3525_length_774_cov_239.806676:433-729(-)